MCSHLYDYWNRREFLKLTATTAVATAGAIGLPSARAERPESTMEALYFVRAGDLEWREVTAPRIETPKDAIVRPLAVARCDLDAVVVTGRFPASPPFAIGHEFVGEIVDVGEAVRTFKPGDTVISSFQISCGECSYCVRGFTRNCTTVEPGAMYGYNRGYGGAIADFIRIPYAEHMLVPKPPSVDPVAIASISDNVIDGWRTVAPYIEQSIHRDVLVVGGGAQSIGLYAVAVSIALGAATTDYVDSDRARLEIAESLGARTLSGPPPDRLGPYDITVDASVNPDGLRCAAQSTRGEGYCTSVGIYPGPSIPMPLDDMYNRGITFTTGRINSRTWLPNVLNLVVEGKLDPSRVTTRVADWESAPEALLDPSAKVIVHRVQ